MGSGCRDRVSVEWLPRPRPLGGCADRRTACVGLRSPSAHISGGSRTEVSHQGPFAPHGRSTPLRWENATPVNRLATTRHKAPAPKRLISSRAIRLDLDAPMHFPMPLVAPIQRPSEEPRRGGECSASTSMRRIGTAWWSDKPARLSCTRCAGLAIERMCTLRFAPVQRPRRAKRRSVQRTATQGRRSEDNFALTIMRVGAHALRH